MAFCEPIPRLLIAPLTLNPTRLQMRGNREAAYPAVGHSRGGGVVAGGRSRGWASLRRGAPAAMAVASSALIAALGSATDVLAAGSSLSQSLQFAFIGTRATLSKTGT